MIVKPTRNSRDVWRLFAALEVSFFGFGKWLIVTGTGRHKTRPRGVCFINRPPEQWKTMLTKQAPLPRPPIRAGYTSVWQNTECSVTRNTVSEDSSDPFLRAAKDRSAAPRTVILQSHFNLCYIETGSFGIRSKVYEAPPRQDHLVYRAFGVR